MPLSRKLALPSTEHFFHSLSFQKGGPFTQTSVLQIILATQTLKSPSMATNSLSSTMVKGNFKPPLIKLIRFPDELLRPRVVQDQCWNSLHRFLIQTQLFICFFFQHVLLPTILMQVLYFWQRSISRFLCPGRLFCPRVFFTFVNLCHYSSL